MTRPIEILLVEDSPGDVWLTREMLLQGAVPKKINVVTNGEQALDYLFARGVYTKAVRPDLVLLDLNLPRRDGLEVLREVKNDPTLRSITVVVLTTSEAPSDVNAAYDLNANCYIVKPSDLERFTAAIRGIEEFWMSMATLPTTFPPAKDDEGQADSAAGGQEGESNGAHARSGIGYPVRHARYPVRRRVSVPRAARPSRRRALTGNPGYRHR